MKKTLIYPVVFWGLFTTHVLEAAVVSTTLPSAKNVSSYEENYFTGEIYYIDINGDSIDDFAIISSSYATHSSFVTFRANRFLYEISPPPNIGGLAAPVELGSLIGNPFPDARLGWSSSDFTDGYVSSINDFDSAATISLELSTGWGSAYPEEGARLPIGIELHLQDGVHYGYIDVLAGGRFGGFVQVYGWAWETEPGVPIVAAHVPEPSASLFLLCAAAGLFPRRRPDAWHG